MYLGGGREKHRLWLLFRKSAALLIALLPTCTCGTLQWKWRERKAGIAQDALFLLLSFFLVSISFHALWHGGALRCRSAFKRPSVALASRRHLESHAKAASCCPHSGLEPQSTATKTCRVLSHNPHPPPHPQNWLLFTNFVLLLLTDIQEVHCFASAEKARDELRGSPVECISKGRAQMNQWIRLHRPHELPASIPRVSWNVRGGGLVYCFPDQCCVFVCLFGPP